MDFYMRVFLNGGGCGKQTIDTYKEINKIIDHEKPVLYVPLPSSLSLQYTASVLMYFE